MKKVAVFFKWYYLLNKRLFKKISFLLILCSIPILVVALGIASSDPGGIVDIVLAQTDPTDPVSSSVATSLTSNTGIIRFIEDVSPEEALNMVKYGEADGAWIFSSGVEDALAGFAEDPDGQHACAVTVIEREDNVALRLAREKLTSALSYRLGYVMMRDYSRDLAKKDAIYAAMSGITDDELSEFYAAAFGNEDIFVFRYSGSGEDVEDAGDTSFLTVPVRGILSVAVVLCGLAVAVFYLQDERSGVFCRISRGAKPFFSFGYQLTGIIDAAVVVVVALFAAGLSVSFWREIASMALYVIASALFCILIRRLCGNVTRLSTITPIIIVGLIGVNPILLRMSSMRPVQLMTPVFYYLQSAHNPAYLGYMAIYSAALAVIDFALLRIFDRT